MLSVDGKPSIVIVQGFGFSGSSAVSDFLSTSLGSPGCSITESLLLKSFFHLAYSIYSQGYVKKNNKNRLERNFLAIDQESVELSEWQNSRNLLFKAGISYPVYLKTAEKTLSDLYETKQIKNEIDRKKKVVEVSSKFFSWISLEIEKKNGLCVYDNLVNAHLLKWLDIVDFDMFHTVRIYSVYRRGLKDQFFEQYQNSIRHRVGLKNDFKNIFVYLARKAKSSFRLNGAGNINQGISLLPTGANWYVKSSTIVIFWRFFLRDLLKRFSVYESAAEILKTGDRVYVKKICFEEFVSDDEKLRKLIFSEVFNVEADESTDKNIDDFDYSLSQKNIDKYKVSDLAGILDALTPETIDDLLVITQ